MRLAPLVLAASFALSGLTLHTARPARAEGSESPAGLKTFGAWTGTCDNIGTCVAFGAAEDVFFYVRIIRDAGASAPPRVILVYVAPDDTKDTKARLTLALEGLAPGAPPAAPVGPYEGALDPQSHELRIELGAGAPSLAFINAIRNADSLGYAVQDQKGALSLKGLSATLRWIDAQQGRAGTPTALVAQGMTPIGQVPGPRQPPEVRAGRPDLVREIEKPVLSAALLAKAKDLQDCEAEVVTAHENAEAWQLGPNLVLVSVPCQNGAYNFSTALYFTKPDGSEPRAVPLPLPPGDDGGMARNLVVNMSFDPKTLILNDFSKGRGIGDCGATRGWVWTGTAFALLEASRLDACAGATPEDWPSLYKARRVD